MKNSSLRRELLWFVFAIGAAVLALGVWDAWERRAEMVAQRKTELRHVLDLASSIVQNGKRGVREGLTLEQAQRNVAQRLAQLRYGADGYVGAFRDDYSLLVHPDSAGRHQCAGHARRRGQADLRGSVCAGQGRRRLCRLPVSASGIGRSPAQDQLCGL